MRSNWRSISTTRLIADGSGPAEVHALVNPIALSAAKVSSAGRIVVAALTGLGWWSIGMTNSVLAGVLTLPPPQFALNANGLESSSAGTLSYDYCVPGYGCATATASAFDTPSVAIAGGGGVGGSASAGVAYSVAVLGGTELVKIDFATSGFASGGLASQAATSVGGFGGVACSGSAGCGAPGSFSISGSFEAQACDLTIENCGSSFGVTLGVSADGNVGGSYSAYADPYIYIDPNFLASNPGYYLVFSAGIQNAPLPAVPEPSTLLMISAALVGMSMMRDKRRADFL